MRERKLLLYWVPVFAAILVGASAYAGASAKVEICHFPGGNPDNAHTIVVSEKAVPAHLAHGDQLGSCFALCDEDLCDDGNACTVDACDPSTGTCLPDHPPVACDDGDACTVDSCDPLTGCLSTPIACDDSNACTADICSGGECLHPPIDCGDLQLCDPLVGCYDACSGVICDPADQCRGPGVCVFPGDCLEGPVLADGTICEDGDGDTEGDQCIAGTCQGTFCDGSDPSLITTCWEESPLGNICEGVTECTSTGWSQCRVPEEVCDGIDNDCDGVIDQALRPDGTFGSICPP